MRSRSTFWVVLYRESWFIPDLDTLYRMIIQVHMGDLYMLCFFHRFRVNTKSMVLGSDLAAACHQVFHRVVKSHVTMVNLKSWYIIGQCQQLVTEANTKDRLFLFHDTFYSVNCIVHSCRITGTIRNEITGWFE